MNTYTRRFQESTEDVGISRNAERKNSYVTGMAVRISLICLLIFLAVSARIHLTAKIERLYKDTDTIKKQISEINVQIMHKRSEKEHLTSWPIISKRISQYRLNLESGTYEQREYVSLLQEPRYGKMQRMRKTAANMKMDKSRVLAQNRSIR